MDSIKSIDITRCHNNVVINNADLVVEERALLIHVVYGKAHNRNLHVLTTTMRTPGYDEELCIGLLYSLEIIGKIEDITEIKPCIRNKLSHSFIDLITIQLHVNCSYAPLDVSFGHPRYSSCGICGIKQLRYSHKKLEDTFIASRELLVTLPEHMKRSQDLFNKTGGTHAAALFNQDGDLISLFEDIGRHNALDKLIGHGLSQGYCFSDTILLLSSRISYEMVAKAARANIKIVAAVGAVSSLAVEMAERCHMTLVGFLRHRQLNIYTHKTRISYD